MELKQTPDQYLDSVWAENKVDVEPEDAPPSGDQDKALKKLRTNERLYSRTDPDASLITYYDHRGMFLAHKVHVAVADGAARIITAVDTTPGGCAEAYMAVVLVPFFNEIKDMLT